MSYAAVVSLSGGAQSFVAAQRAVARYGAASVACLFADTSAEDADLYRFVIQGAAHLGVPLFVVRDGRTPQEVLRHRRFLGSGRGAPCSDILKRRPVDAWLAKHAPAAVLVVGMTWEEPHRVEAITARYGDSRIVWAPLTEPPYLTRDDVFAAVRDAGIALPRLYARGYAHNNCGGACVRAGQGAWAHLLKDNPALYAEWEVWEQDMRELAGPHAILRDRSGGDHAPLPLVELRRRVQGQPDTVDLFDIGGCGCFAPDTAEAAP